MNKAHNHIILKNTLKLFFPFMIVIALVTFFILDNNNKTELYLYKKLERNLVDVRIENIQEDLTVVIDELFIISSLKQIENYWNEPDNKVLNESLSELFLSVSKNRKLYDQIRLIDENGMEIIRVNFNNGSPTLVDKDKLQNKKGRYYFDDAFQLNRGEIFVSPLDLNIEHGEIEKPLKPMLRFATPVFDKKGDKKGIVLFNYMANHFLYHSLNPGDQIIERQLMLLNKDGYWLKGPSSEVEWGFMYEDKANLTFPNLYKEEWDKIKRDSVSQFLTKNGLFTSRTVHPVSKGLTSSDGAQKPFAHSQREISANEYFWKIVSFIPTDILIAEKKSRVRIAVVIILLLGSISFFVSWRISQVNLLRTLTLNKLQLSENRLRQMNATKDKFFSIISHDLIGQFSTMLGFSGRLYKKFDQLETNKQKKMSEFLYQLIERTYKMLENLLMWSRSQRGVIEMNLQSTNIYLTSNEIIDLLIQSAKNKSIDIKNEIPKDMKILVDRDMFLTIVRNLVSNAIKFTPANGTITLKAIRKENLTELIVQDTGIGISEEIIDKIFDVNENISTNGTADEQGTGLGLILCKEFVEKHGGTIWVESQPGNGTSFIFTIPNNN